MQETVTIVHKSHTLFKKRSRLYVEDLQNICDGFVLMESDFLNINSRVKDNIIVDGKTFILYDSNTKCSCGFRFQASEKQNEYYFTIEYPASVSDVVAMFNYIESFMVFIDSDEFYFDDEVYNKEDIMKIYHHCSNFNKITIKELLKEEEMIIKGMFFPFEVESSFIRKLNDKKDDEEIYDDFDEYIFKKQDLEYFFMRPRLTYKTEDNKLIIIFAIGDSYQFMIYKNKEDYLLLSDYDSESIEQWLVILPGDNVGNSEQIVKYDDFINNIPDKYKINLDEKILLVNELDIKKIKNCI